MTLGLGYSEIAIILVIALIVIGPRRLPELLRTVGKLMGQLRRASDDLRREILFSDEISSVKNSIRDAIDPTVPPPVPPKFRTKSGSSEKNGDKAPDGGQHPEPESGEELSAKDEPKDGQ